MAINVISSGNRLLTEARSSLCGSNDHNSPAFTYAYFVRAATAKGSRSGSHEGHSSHFSSAHSGPEHQIEAQGRAHTTLVASQDWSQSV